MHEYVSIVGVPIVYVITIHEYVYIVGVARLANHLCRILGVSSNYAALFLTH